MEGEGDAEGLAPEASLAEGELQDTFDTLAAAVDVQAADKEKKKKLRDTEKLDWSIPEEDRYVARRGVRLPIAALDWDLQCKFGQIRARSEEILAKRRAEIESNPPSELSDTIVVPKDLTGMRFLPPGFPSSFPSVSTATTYWIIGGQHTVYILREKGTELEKQGRTVPEWYQYVRATVLSHSTPVPVRELIAGSNQNKQGTAAPIPLSTVAKFVSEAPASMDFIEKLKTAVHKSGHPRPDSRVCTLGRGRGRGVGIAGGSFPTHG